jgi:hypothetical protein
MCGRLEHCRDADLARIAQSDAIARKEADRQVVPHGRCEPMHHSQAWRRLPTLNLAGQTLADASPLRYLSLR